MTERQDAAERHSPRCQRQAVLVLRSRWATSSERASHATITGRVDERSERNLDNAKFLPRTCSHAGSTPFGSRIPEQSLRRRLPGGISLVACTARPPDKRGRNRKIAISSRDPPDPFPPAIRTPCFRRMYRRHGSSGIGARAHARLRPWSTQGLRFPPQSSELSVPETSSSQHNSQVGRGRRQATYQVAMGRLDALVDFSPRDKLVDAQVWRQSRRGARFARGRRRSSSCRELRRGACLTSESVCTPVD